MGEKADNSVLLRSGDWCAGIKCGHNINRDQSDTEVRLAWGLRASNWHHHYFLFIRARRRGTGEQSSLAEHDSGGREEVAWWYDTCLPCFRFVWKSHGAQE